MIIEYHKPNSIDDACKLLSRESPRTVPLGGGTVLSQYHGEPIAVVDLQDLGIDGIEAHGNMLFIGASTTLQSVIESELIDNEIKKACEIESTYNLRQTATIGGCIASGSWGSPLLSIIFASDAELTIQPDEIKLKIGKWISLTQEEKDHRFISHISIAKEQHVALETISKTPKSKPEIMLCASGWESGRIRYVLMDKRSKKMQLLLDTDEGDIEKAFLSLINAHSHSLSSYFPQYYSKILEILFTRCWHKVKGKS